MSHIIPFTKASLFLLISDLEIIKNNFSSHTHLPCVDSPWQGVEQMDILTQLHFCYLRYFAQFLCLIYKVI
jgi:hypothetical protein